MPRPVNIFLALPLALACIPVHEAWAQRSRTEVQYPVRTFAVTEVDGEIGAEYNYFGETIRGNNSGRVRYSNHYFQEYILGRVRGYAYHPRFIDYSGSVKLGFSQQSLHHTDGFGESRSSSENRTLLGYNIRLDILKENNLSGTVSASREERVLMGLFLDTYRVESETYSATARWRTRNTSMDLTATRRESQEYGFRSSGETVSDTILYNLRHQLGPRIRTDVRYRLQSFSRDFTTRTTSGVTERETEYLTNDLNVSNRINFDNEGRLSLRSNFRFYDRNARSGLQDLRTYHLEETLRYNASRIFRPYLKASYTRNEFEDLATNVYRGEAGFDGDLYDSLSYHLDFQVTRSDFDTFTEDRYGPTARLNYRKDTPVGVLSAGYSRTLEQVERSSSGGIQQIFDERIVLSASLPTFLSRVDVIPSSIIVTNLAGEVVYQPGFDYEIVIEGARVGLRLLPGGLATEGEVVLVDYRVDASTSVSYVGDDESMYIRHDFTRGIDGLSLYARRHTFKTRNVSSGSNINRLEYTNDTVGLRQRLGDFAFTSEYEMYEDDFSSYNRWFNQLEGNHNLHRSVRWGWSAGFIETWYDDDFGSGQDDRGHHQFARTHVNGTFSQGGFWRVEGSLLNDSGRTERTVVGGLARVGYQWRRLTMESGVRYEQYDIPDNKQDRFQLYTGVKMSLGRRVFGRNPS